MLGVHDARDCVWGCTEMTVLQEEQLRHAQKADDVRRKKVAAQEDADRATVLDEMRALDASVTEARERLRRYEAAAHAAQGEAEKATGVAEEAEARRDAVRGLPACMGCDDWL